MSKPTFSNEVSHLPTGMAIGDLVKRVNERVILLDNPLQRHVVWSARHKTCFIDSLFKRYVIHAIILVKKTFSCYDCIDGKQRLTTLVQFVDNSFPYQSTYYKELDEHVRREFDYTQLPVIVYNQDMDRSRVEEMFSRIQEGVKLSMGERINARQESPIVASLLQILERAKVASPTAFTYIARRQRMSEVKLVFALYWFLAGRSIDNMSNKILDSLASKKPNKQYLELVEIAFTEVMATLEGYLRDGFEIPTLNQENMVYVCLLLLLDRAKPLANPRLSVRTLNSLLAATKSGNGGAKLRDVFVDCMKLKAKSQKQLSKAILTELGL
jgi:hypothetical protein